MSRLLGLPVRESTARQAVVNGLSSGAPAFIKNFPVPEIMRRF
ncbi:hypothetical protein [Bradyrhizobium sp. AT1]|nr:hypothetical protein [Bradyrhizobium sp. AT1]